MNLVRKRKEEMIGNRLIRNKDKIELNKQQQVTSLIMYQSLRQMHVLLLISSCRQ